MKAQLYAKQNKRELEKLKQVPQSKAKNRYLLLLDLCGEHNLTTLKVGYLKTLPRHNGSAAVRVVYVRRSAVSTLLLGGK